jgi:hypothetical protein
MNKIIKRIGGVLLGVLLVSLFLVAKPAEASSLGLEGIAASSTVVDPCLNTGGAFGFVFCPAVDMFADVIDYFLSHMDAGFNWTYLSDTNIDVIGVWSSILPIANVLFIVIFILVIYSVATGQGLNNYSIKKIMPRLVLIAIAINVSYYICAALIDISNIIGTSLYDLVYSTLSGGTTATSFESLADNVFQNSGGALKPAGGAIGALLLLVSSFTVVLLAVGAVFACIAARNVVLMLLLLLAPLAFSTALLPNTENLFRKWGNNFLRLLVIYPAFMFVWAICRGLQAALLDYSADALQLILAMLLSVAPVAVIVPLFKGTGGLTGRVANMVQRGSAGLSSTSITSGQATDRKINSQNIDQINQKKFTANKTMATNVNNNGGTQNNFSDETNSALNSRTTLAANELRTPVSGSAADRKSKRARTLSANLKSKAEVSNVQVPGSSLQDSINSSRSTSTTTNTNVNSQNNAVSRQTSSASSLNSLSNSSQTSNIQNSATAAASAPRLDLNGEFDKLADVVKAKNSAQNFTRERAKSTDKKPTPTPRRQTFADNPASDKKPDKVFDISSKSPTNTIFSGEGQQVSIENSGGTSQLIENQVLDNPAAIDGGAPSIVPTDGTEPTAAEDEINGNEINQLAENVRNQNSVEPSDDTVAAAPSIVDDVISDDDRQQRFASVEGQKELAKMLTIANIRQFLPSDIDYILGIGPLLNRQGEELAPTSDISDEPEYKAAAEAVSGYISTLSDDQKQTPDALKWQQKLGLL